MLARSTLSLIGLSLTALITPLQSLAHSYPLKYDANSGLYSIKLYAGKQQEPIEALVDTGSANLNFISRDTKCNQCIYFGKDSYLNLLDSGVKLLYPDTFYDVRYGSGDGTMKAYKGMIGFSKDSQISALFSVYTSGTHVSNILGLAFQNIAAPSLYPFEPYFDSIIKHYNYRGFALAMCGKHNSHMLVGLKDLYSQVPPSTIQFAPIVVKKYYVTLLNKIYADTANGGKKELLSYSNPITKTAIIDSGTSGYVVLSQPDRQTVVDYIYNHTPKSVHSNLSNDFWNNDVCVNKTLIDFSKFPSFTFALGKADAPNESIDIHVGPEDYINSDGCGENSVHMGFLSLGHFNKKKLPRKYVNDFPSLKILGSTFMSHHLVIFDRDPRQDGDFGRIGFIRLNKECQIPS